MIQTKRVRKNQTYTYEMLINEETTNIELNKITNLDEKVTSLLFNEKIEFRKGFFLRNQKGFNSFLLSYEVDLIFATYEGKIIKLLPSFKQNTLSKYYHDAHWCIVLAGNTLKYFKILEGDYLVIQRKRSKKGLIKKKRK